MFRYEDCIEFCVGKMKKVSNYEDDYENNYSV